MTNAELISDEIERAVRGEAWHGPSLRELLDVLTAEEAMQRPVPAAHSIWELVLHITSWSNIVLRRLTGGEVEPREGEDWPPPGEISAARWTGTRAALTESHERLSAAVAGLSDAKLAENAPQSTNSVAVMVHGVSQHAAYHGGQIAVLRKSITTLQRRIAT